jgi:LTXXQ motif family protein
MKSIRMAVAAAAVVATMMAASAGAEDQPVQQDSSGSMMDHSAMDHGMMDHGTMDRGMAGHGGMGPGMMGGGPGHAMCGMAHHVEGHLAHIKSELKITEAQEALWNSYAAAARDNVNAMLAHCAAMMSGHGAAAVSLPARLDQHEEMMAARLEALRAVNKALKPLYAALSDSQKHTADELFWGPMGMM